jgi:hypothetical protein
VKRTSRQYDGTFKDQMTIQTGIDGYRVVAERSGTLAGIDDSIFDDETKDHPNKASVTVYRMIEGIRVGFTASARWNEYVQTYNRNGQMMVGPMWKKMPYLMLAKCAEALALRKAFPNDLTGIYTNEEMSQADNVVPATPVATTAPTPATPAAPKPPEKPAQVIEGSVVPTQQPAPKAETDERAKNLKTCPFCNKQHDGQYQKCYTCWQNKVIKTVDERQAQGEVIGNVAPPQQENEIRVEDIPF